MTNVAMATAAASGTRTRVASSRNFRTLGLIEPIVTDGCPRPEPDAGGVRKDEAVLTILNDTYARLWHPWLRINRVLRAMLRTRWSAEAWSIVRVEFKKALAPQSEIRRGGWFS